MSQLGETIKALRVKRSLSLGKLSSAADISKQHLWDLERGASDNPSVEVLVNLSAALGVPASQLFQAAVREKGQ